MLAIRFIGRLRKYLSKDHLKMMVNAFVMSRLDYCNSLQLFRERTLSVKKGKRQNILIENNLNTVWHEIFAGSNFCDFSKYLPAICK